MYIQKTGERKYLDKIVLVWNCLLYFMRTWLKIWYTAGQTGVSFFSDEDWDIGDFFFFVLDYLPVLTAIATVMYLCHRSLEDQNICEEHWKEAECQKLKWQHPILCHFGIWSQLGDNLMFHIDFSAKSLHHLEAGNITISAQRSVEVWLHTFCIST